MPPGATPFMEKPINTTAATIKCQFRVILPLVLSLLCISSAPAQPTTSSDKAVAKSSEPQTGSESAEVKRYLAVLQAKVASQWKTEPGSEGQSCIVLAHIDSDGNLQATEIRKSSGNMQFDTRALNAVLRSAPFPIPPPEADRATLKRVPFRFPADAAK